MLSVILRGGVGSRLWPVSRALHPKPFIRLADGESFIQKSYRRGARAPGAEATLVIANRQLYFKAAEEYETSGAGLKPGHILEPSGRNTGPAIAAAAREALACDPSAKAHAEKPLEAIQA